MFQGVTIRLLVKILTCFTSIRLIWSDIQSFKCMDNELGHTPGFTQLMPAGKTTGIPDAQGISAIQCALLCLEHGQMCFSFAYHDGLCFLRNISLAHQGKLCGVSVLEGRLRCPLGRIGDIFIAFGGKSRMMMECMCGLVGITFQERWTALSNVSRYNCIDNCITFPCSILSGVMSNCWICNGHYDYCLPSGDSNRVYPQRIGCMPISKCL